ncbi:signal transduction histidine-protein kinase AtoS [Anaeromyxobacter sp. PSR-1]|nr:signal transduction histidine-protein kinase AtoS [Anaeromyxobacter sp. PSR-1]
MAGTRRRPGRKAAKRTRAPSARPKPRPRPKPGRRRRPPPPPVTPDPSDAVLLRLSRELAEARAEDQISGALARALDAVFPGRAFSIRLVDPRTLALTTFYASGRLRPDRSGRLVLARDAVEEAGLSAAALAAGGVRVVEREEPLFEGYDEASSAPLAVSGALYGVLSLEYARGGPGNPAEDRPLLRRVAAHAALGVRNVRSIDELTYLKTYLEELIEHANALIWAVDRDRSVIVWNAALAKLSGLPAGEVLGGEALLRAPDDERPRLAAVLGRSLGGERVDGFETRLVRRDGGEVRVAVNTAPITGASGEVDGVILIGQDLTLLRSMQAAAEHAERLAAIGRLVAGVVHELNNPLTAVTMYSDVLLERFTARGQDPADVEKLRAIKDAGQRIQRLARDLVTYARPTGAHTEAVDLVPAVDEAGRMAKTALKEAGAGLVRDGGDGPYVVEGNRPSLVQVVLALVTNAAQAVPPGAEVRVGLSREGGEVVLTVADAGAGMPPEVAARAFEPFFTTRAGVGIGLGLPIVQGIVERHGGSVSLTTAAGRGTTVTVRLPARAATPTELRPVGPADARQRPPGDTPTHPRLPRPPRG